MARLRLLVLAPDYPPSVGGIQHMMGRLVANFASFDTTVVTRRMPGSEASDLTSRATVVRHGLRGLPNKLNIGLLNIWAIFEALRGRPHVILSGHIVMSPGSAAIRRLLGVPVAQYFYGKEVSDRPALARFASANSDENLVLSQYGVDLLGRGRNAMVIPPGVDLTANTEGIKSGDPLLLTVSRMTERYKGHDVMIRAMPLIRARYPKCQWTVIGDGTLSSALKSQAEALGENGIQFVGQLDDKSRDSLYARARLFVLPSRTAPNGGGEGFGIVLLEAGANGLAVVAGDVAGARDAVVDGVTGLLVDPNDHVALTDAICDLLADRPRSDAMGRAGRARAQAFAWPAIAARVEAVLLGLAGPA